MTIFGVDVSSHQGTVDWSKVAAAGFKFAINRACLDTRPDATWAANNRGAKAHDLIPGAFHFLYPSGGGGGAAQPAADQCDAFLAAIGDPEGLLIALDVESDKTPDGSFTYKPTFADVKAWVARFRQKHPTHPLLIYSGGWYWTGSGYPIHNADGSGLGLLWDSHYVSAGATTAGKLYAGVPASWWGPRYGGWDRVTVLQFSSSGLVPGVTGHCDVDAFQGTVEQLRALTTSKPVTAPSPEADMLPLATYTPGSTITVKPTANVRFDAKLAAPIRRVVATTETWAIIGSVKGDVDPDGGSDVWYVRWQAGTYEYTAKSNVLSGPTAPAGDCAAAVTAATTPLQATIDSQTATIASLHNDVANIARLERERIADAEATRIRNS